MADPDHTSSEAERAAEWSPAELDRLEDALERWTAEDVEADPEDSSLTPRMRGRLESYRDLLAMTRAELPMEEVPDALLAGVLAEAARGGTAAPREAQVAQAVRVSFWERLRRSMLLPGVALAGSAALLLWIVQPGESAPESFDSQIAAKTPARLARDASPAPAAAQEPVPEGAVEEAKVDEAEPSADDAPAPPPPASAPIVQADRVADREADAMEESKPLDAKSAGSRTKKKAEMPASAQEYLPGLEDVPSDAGADKDELRDALEAADKARRKGRCAEAMKIYLSAMGLSGPRNDQAQVRAGYALCLQNQGDDATASRYFEAASKLSPSIDAWVKRERGDAAPNKKPSKSKLNIDEPFK